MNELEIIGQEKGEERVRMRQIKQNMSKMEGEG